MDGLEGGCDRSLLVTEIPGNFAAGGIAVQQADRFGF
jgi:hypothetical protein